jgi:hypothetical protein
MSSTSALTQSTETHQGRFLEAMKAIDEGHSLDPRTVVADGISVPYELHYAQKMSEYMGRLTLSPSHALQLAIRAQHFRRWEVPRSSYPMTKLGYHSWRNALKKRQAEQAAKICKDAGLSEEETERVAALIRKEGLREGDEDAQVLEDAACLVFLEEQFDDFEKGMGDEEKVVNILRKTWAKMSDKGKAEALKISMSEHAEKLVKKALEN